MPARIEPLAITRYSATSALGRGVTAHVEALQRARGGLRANDFSSAPLDCFIGGVEGIENEPLPAGLSHWECRNNRLAWLGLQQDGLRDAVAGAIARCGAHRVALVLGTSTASIGATEEAYRRLEHGRFPGDLRRPQIHTPHSLTAFVAAATGIAGPALTVSTACSSSAKVFASAERLIRLGVADAALVGGVDSLCDSVLFGFNALELVSKHPCRPFDLRRDGISIGEAAAFALLERAGEVPDAPRLIGYGESSDAYHMSTPHPEGRGARGPRRGCRRLPQPAWHRHRQERRGGGRAVADLSGAHARQFHQGLHRPHAGRGRRAGSGDRAAGDRARFRAAQPRLRRGDARMRGVAGVRTGTATPPRRAQQLVRLRRQQRLPCVRAPGGGMNGRLEFSVEGIGAWTRGAPDWPALRAVLRGERTLRADAPVRPAGNGLPAAERRRAPDGVLLAVEVAAQAAAMAQRDPAGLPCVFASSFGEPAITDYVCATLARAPQELSPTKFHNSVLNAAAGYWTIATGCTAASSAVTAHLASFGAGLLEAAALASADGGPVLFAACDVAAAAG